MKTLVTGGAGFIGSHLAKELLSMKHEVIILDDLSGGYTENIPVGAIFIKGCITDYDLLSELFQKHQFDYVFHLAAYAAEGLSHFIRRFNYNNNLIGSVNLINLAVLHKIKCFVFTSSIAVYGTGQVPLKEETTPLPEDPYGISKYAVELDLKCAHEMFGLDYIIFRPHNVYGENQNIGDRYRNVIGIFINQIMTKQPFSIFGDGKQIRAFSYISDVVPFMANSINNEKAYNEVFNIGGDNPYTVLDVANEVSKNFNTTNNIQFLPARNEVVEAYSDHSKLKDVFGENKSVSLEEGVAKMVKWAKINGPRTTKPFANIEVKINMPSKWAEWM